MTISHIKRLFKANINCGFQIKLASLIILIFLLGSFPVLAQSPDQIQDQIIRNQQNTIEQQNREKEFERIQKEREQLQKPEEEKPSEEAASNLSQCFPIKTIEFIGAESLSKRARKKIAEPFINQCFDSLTFSKLVKEVNSYYQNAGYITVQVTIPQQNIKFGNLKLQIIEGKIHDLSINKDRFTDKMQEFTAFGFTKNKKLNVDDINQGLFQMNRLPSNKATMKIEAAQDVGFSDVMIDNKAKFPASATIGYDDLGNKFTGIRRTNFAGTLDDALFLNDQINVNYSANLDDPNDKKDFRSIGTSVSVPFKYNLFSYDYSRTTYMGQSPGITTPFIINGYSHRSNFSIDRTLLNNTDYRIATNVSLTKKDSANYTNGIKTESNDRSLTIGSLSFSVSKFFKNGANLYIKPQYSKGLTGLNADQDKGDLAADIPKAQFQLYKLYANISKKFQIPWIDIPVTLSSEMDSQIAQDTLYGSEKFSVGGYYSVRGFQEDYIDGDSGYYFRNNANFNIGQILVPLFSDKEKVADGASDVVETANNEAADNAEKTPKNNNKFSQNIANFLYKVSLEPFYDYGYARDRFSGDAGRLSGAGIKTIFSGQYFDASLTYSWALQKSQLITSTEKENKMLYFEMSMKCC